jgi:hypothetical protein
MAIVGCILVGPSPRVKMPEERCSHVSEDVKVKLTPDARRYLEAAESFTDAYMSTVFGEGPYPPSLCQGIKEYFIPSSPAEAERAQARRARAKSIIDKISRPH